MMPTPSLLRRDDEGRLIHARLVASGADGGDPDQRWLIGIDDSAHCLRALGEVLRITAPATRPAIRLISVQGWLAKEAAESALVERGWAATELARSMVEDAGRSWQLDILMGDPAETLIAEAANWPLCRIAIGSRGLGAIGSLLFGSVAYKVLHLSPAPVLMVR